MIMNYEALTMKNVVSKRYFTDKEHIEEAQKTFLKELLSLKGAVIKGPFVYMIEYTTPEEILAIWFMTSVGNDDSTIFHDYRYDSYFGLEEAICCKIYPEEMQKEADNLYDKMEKRCLQDDVRMISPIYFVKNVLEEAGFYSLYAAVEKIQTR
ncbi:MAG: DUF5085 family protein [Clostridiales bacterium]|nr:DUF5085 family protein [Roseburia sp.]MDD7637337.1 DUF5085 family protein [Clostridiales bacterium]